MILDPPTDLPTSIKYFLGDSAETMTFNDYTSSYLGNLALSYSAQLSDGSSTTDKGIDLAG